MNLQGQVANLILFFPNNRDHENIDSSKRNFRTAVYLLIDV